MANLFLLTIIKDMIIKQTRNTLSDTYLDALKIRQIVFVKGQGVPQSLEIDENEAHCLHFVLYDDNGKAAATCRILPSKDLTSATLQRMAVLSDYRGQSLGKQLLQQVISFCQKQNFQKITLHAQLTAEGFYRKIGFLPCGDIFEEAGIKHVTMEKGLN